MIGILITTFLRDELLYQCLESLNKHWQENYYLILVDQGYSNLQKSQYMQKYFSCHNGKYIEAPFDIGALQARNIAIKEFYRLKIPYILMSADSILFTKKYNFRPIIEFLEAQENYFLCGFNLKNRISWECDMNKTNRFELDIPRRFPITYKCQDFLPVDICRNFFLAKTKLFINALYDEDRKLGDHESSFWRFKEKNYKCFYCSKIEATYKLDRPKEYMRYRDRFNAFKLVMLKKYNLTNWIKYSDALTLKWTKERQSNA